MSKKTVSKVAKKMNTNGSDPVTKKEGHPAGSAETGAAAKTEGKPLNTRVRELRRYAVTKVINRFDWNTRSKAALLSNVGPGEEQYGIGEFAKEDDEKEGIKKGDPVNGMVKMLWTDGQTTPIDVYPVPGKPGEVYVIDGATRLEAAKLLDKHGFTIPRAEKGTIEAWFYPNMTDEDAEDINLLANVGHRDLKTADLAFGIARSGKRKSDSAIAAMLGVGQSFVSKLHRIVKNAPTIAKQWRDTPFSIHYEQVAAIAAMAFGDRQEAWDELIKSKAPTTGDGSEGDKSSPNEWVKKSIEKASAAGKTIGILDARDAVDATSLDFDAELDAVAEAFGIKLKAPGKDGKKATQAQRGKIAKADHLRGIFIPQGKRNTSQALPDGQRLGTS